MLGVMSTPPSTPPPDARPDPSPRDSPPIAASPPERAEVLIIGAGFSGLGMAIRLKRAGLTDFIVLDRDPRTIGGTWRDNTYPGCACDVPSTLYSFSFAPYSDPRTIG